MQAKYYDVIIVGGGLAGLTASRELYRMGYKVLILEARNRLGGRAWTDDRLGTRLELGGGWIHWVQPHIWSEVTRYNLKVSSSPAPYTAYWRKGSEVLSGHPLELGEKMKEGLEKLLNHTRDYLPRPYDPHYNFKVYEIDHLSLLSKLDELHLSDEEYQLLLGRLTTMFNGAIEKAAYTQLMKWFALSSYELKTMAEMSNTYKLKDGTTALVEAISQDAPVDKKLCTPVDRLEKLNGQIKITTRDKKVYCAKSVVVTAPFKALGNIKFHPPLSNQKQQITKDGQISQGIKVWAKVEGPLEPYIAFGQANEVFTFSKYEGLIDGDSLVVASGPNAARIDPTNTKEVEKALKQWFSNIKVKESTGHNWIDDEFSQETWTMLKTNQFSRYHKRLQESEHGIFLSGSNYASGWGGFMDGAIEEGMKVSHRVNKHLLKAAY
ncbi:flavin monoamine oxidase family protein [Alteribacillus bidgolensis]|uniref:Monoamine oxidase n=1 Tax=Alteribacillus bidgolensis TaxID=930129 RepID=A0A1G8QUH9_9BACI|nr:NAD(P)/FAD-dependent oxidoreductase [Alteribacillus bidgolensis]SDJ08283.1 Monoamine oxidase [Alteribacillus bidgolensis]